MNYFLIKLAFDTAVHFGISETAQSISFSDDHFHADTLFSALCHTALQKSGENGLLNLYHAARDGKLLLSDSMPWRGDDLYLPKPFIHSSARKELPTVKIKAMKKMHWLPVREFSAFSESVRGGETFDAEKYTVPFGERTEVIRAAVTECEDALPYQVGTYCFFPDCGLYLIVGLEDEKQAEEILLLFSILGMGGIGGKISSGLGKFHVQKTVMLNTAADSQSAWLYRALTEKSKQNLLISASLPKEEELEAALDGASYRIIRRSGFVLSETFSDSPLKKDSQYFIESGSVLATRYQGDVYSVGSRGGHPVYRYGRPMFLGVDLS